MELLAAFHEPARIEMSEYEPRPPDPEAYESAEHAASIAAIPIEQLPDNDARGELLRRALAGHDVYAYTPIGHDQYVVSGSDSPVQMLSLASPQWTGQRCGVLAYNLNSCARMAMKANLRAYRDTPVSWMVTQGQITKLLNQQDIYDVQFTTISQATAEQSGLTMDKGTIALMLVFQKPLTLPDGKSGNIPVRVIIPNIYETQLNQYYRMLFWYLKSKFEAIDTGLVEFAEEFMAHLQIADKHGISRLWDRFKRSFYNAIGNGTMPDANLLPPGFREGGDE
jgi:hypothetical protein